MKKLALGLFAGLLAGIAQAAPRHEIGLHAFSHHTAPSACLPADGNRCRDFTPGLFYRALRPGLDPVAGYYRNSLRRPTFYYGFVATPWTSADERWSFEFAAVLASGYPAASLVPLVLPGLRRDLGGGWAAAVAVLPYVPEQSETFVFHFTVSRRF